MRCFMSHKECDHFPPKPELVSNNVFMISPFGYPFDEIFKYGIRPEIVEIRGMNIHRADLALQLGYVMCQRICRKIIESEYVVADLSVPNANVYYELGLSLSMKKKIICIANSHSNNDYRFNLSSHESYYIEYNSINDLNPPKKETDHQEDLPTRQHGESKPKQSQQTATATSQIELAIDSPYIIDETTYNIIRDRSEFFKNSNIISFENQNAQLPGLHKITLDNIKNTNMDLEESQGVKDYTNNKIAVIPLKERLEEWKIDKCEVGKHMRIQDFIEQIKDAAICLIDTTQYMNKVNPYIYFFLGLAHGFERVVIPITNSQLEIKFPFDTRGLWHVFYNKEEELKAQLIQILPSIFEELESEKSKHIIKKIWDPFAEIKDIQIFTCARNIDETIGRAKRTNIDKCDYKSVTDLTYFIAQAYPTAKVNSSEPQSKKDLPEIESLRNSREIDNFINDIGKTIELHGDCVIVGSADVNDYSEVSLARIHNVPPYRNLRENQVATNTLLEIMKAKAFLFEKCAVNDEDPKHASTFYKVQNQPLIRWYDKPFECTEGRRGEGAAGKTYGVLTIADNPFFEQVHGSPRKIMVLSGFTGIATLAISQLLIYSDRWKKQLEDLVEKFDEMKKPNVNILVYIEYNIKDIKAPGDIREITKIEFIDIQACPDLSKDILK